MLISLYHHIVISYVIKLSHQLYHQERHGALLQLDFEAFIKSGAAVDLRLDPHHDSSLDFIEKVFLILCHYVNPESGFLTMAATIGCLFCHLKASLSITSKCHFLSPWKHKYNQGASGAEGQDGLLPFFGKDLDQAGWTFTPWSSQIDPLFRLYHTGCFYRTQVSLVRSMGPSLSNWLTEVLQT